MTLKTRLLLALLGFAVVGATATVFVTKRAIFRLEQENTRVARQGISDVVSDNIRLSSKILTKIGETFVAIRSEDAALRVADILRSHKPPFNIRELRADNKLRAVATAQIRVPGENGGVAGHIDMYDDKGLAIIHPNPNVEGKNYSQWKDEFPEMWKLVRESFRKPKVSGYYSFIGEDNAKKRKFMALTRVKDSPFIVSAVVEIDRFFLPVHEKIKRAGEKAAKKADAQVLAVSAHNTQTLISNATMWLLGLLAMGAAAALWLARSVSKPITELRHRVATMGHGDFSIKIPEWGSRETRELAVAFNKLGDDLRQYTEDLKRETAAREAFESEIRTARRIQEALLPHTFPPFPDRPEFELHASLLPAKDVSGDFYDFFFIGENTLALVMADVSGKGLPAAIFMAVARTLIRNLCLTSPDMKPNEVLSAANDYLCLDNDEAMFVTLFLGFLDIPSGRLVYANAGHEPFIVLRPDSPPERLGVLSDFPLGIVPGHAFQLGTRNFRAPETLVLHTDGVTDASNPDGEFFGVEHFLDILAENAAKRPADIIAAVNNALLAFQGENQFDDITIMCLRTRPEGEKEWGRDQHFPTSPKESRSAELTPDVYPRNDGPEYQATCGTDPRHYWGT